MRRAFIIHENWYTTLSIQTWLMTIMITCRSFVYWIQPPPISLFRWTMVGILDFAMANIYLLLYCHLICECVTCDDRGKPLPAVKDVVGALPACDDDTARGEA